MSADSRIVQVAAVLALTFFWGINWPVMKIGLEVIEPWTFRALLVVAGALGCLLLIVVTGDDWRIPRRDWPMLGLLALFQGVLWNGFSGFGIALIDAGRASILAFTMPLWAAALSILLLGERITPQRGIALALGMLGMACLLQPALAALSDALLGTGLMLAAAASWGMATVIFKKADWSGSIVAVTGWHFALGAVPLTIAAMTFGRPSSLLDVDLRTGFALIYSATMPMVFCQLVWFTLVRRLPASLASMNTLLVPLIGVASSAIILGERLGLFELAALVFVLAALCIILPGISLPASRRPQPASRPE